MTTTNSRERRNTFHARSMPRAIARADENQLPAIEGYAAVFYDGTEKTEYRLWSDAVERIMPGAFDAAISENHDVRALFNHDPSQLLGRTSAGTLSLSIDQTGLRYSIDVAETSVGRDVVTWVERRDVTGSSFLFVPLETVWRDEKRGDRYIEIREVVSVELYDVGPVTFPAYTTTEAEVAKRSRDEWRKLCQPSRCQRAARLLQIHAAQRFE